MGSQLLPQLVKAAAGGTLTGSCHDCPNQYEALPPGRRTGLPASDRAVFLDRDGVLIADTGYPDDPDAIRILPGVMEALLHLQDAGWRLVVVTNQSGMARGYFSLETLDRIHARLVADFAAAGVYMDALYYCPHHPQGVAPFAVPCDHRKPAPGMLVSAASPLGLDLSRCWMIGDKEDDVRAGHAAGCRSVRIAFSGEPASTKAEITAANLSEAVERLLAFQ